MCECLCVLSVVVYWGLQIEALWHQVIALFVFEMWVDVSGVGVLIVNVEVGGK